MKVLPILICAMILLSGCSTAQPTAGPVDTPVIATSISSPSPIPETKIAITATETTQEPEATNPASTKEVISPTPAVLTETTASPTLSPTSTTAAGPTPTLAQDAWKQMPVIPAISNTVTQIFQRGVEMGNNPHAFSKIGDCGSTPAWFLGDFDRGSDFYRLGDYQGLSAVIQEFQGSYSRTSLAARSGFNAPSLFVPLWADRTYCNANETPLACEYRVHKPVIAFIMLGTNDIWHPEDFEPTMRQIIEVSIQTGVVPILSTKADDAEGDGSINAAIARLAYEYDLPLWNFWLAVQSLPDQGLQEDQAHLTWGRNFFDDPEALTKAWPIRNLNALQMLNAVWRKVTGQTQ